MRAVDGDHVAALSHCHVCASRKPAISLRSMARPLNRLALEHDADLALSQI